jgi:membrane associated rhomboid family serine protease
MQSCASYKARRRHSGLQSIAGECAVPARKVALIGGSHGTPLDGLNSVILLIFLVLVAYIAFKGATPEQRAHLGQGILTRIGRVKDAATRQRPELAAFRDALRARTPWTPVTPAIAALNAVVFVMMLFGHGSFSDPQTLVGWGAIFGPPTTNGQWWRLATMMFVHAGFVSLAVNLAGLAQAGLLLERLIGNAAFAAVYLAAGILAALVSLLVYPIAVSAGASGAVFGVYGLLFVTLALGISRQSASAVPLRAITRLLPAAALFFFYNLGNDNVQTTAEMSGFAVGVLAGVALHVRMADEKPPAWRAAATFASAAVIAIACVVPLRGVGDVRPELARIAELERENAGHYQYAVERLRKDHLSAGELADFIDQKILPELRDARARLKAIDGVPPEHKPLVAGADDYFKLRDESWRLRSQGLRRTNMFKLRLAEADERAAIESLHAVMNQIERQ